MQNDEIKANDEFILHSSDGKDYKIVIYNVNHFRPPESVVAFFLFNEDEKPICHGNDEVWFVGEGFFLLNKEKMERVNK